MNRSILSFAAAVLLTMTALSGFAAEPVHVPATHQAAASAKLIARAARAVRDYVAACATGNHEAVARIVTNDAVIEYVLEEPGTYLVVKATALSAANLSGNARKTGTRAPISNLSIFPTNDSNVVFVHYTTSFDARSAAEHPDSEHLALLEMRGDRILKIRNFSTDAATISRDPNSNADIGAANKSPPATVPRAEIRVKAPPACRIAARHLTNIEGYSEC
jgi:hypothetical protein